MVPVPKPPAKRVPKAPTLPAAKRRRAAAFSDDESSDDESSDEEGGEEGGEEESCDGDSVTSGLDGGVESQPIIEISDGAVCELHSLVGTPELNGKLCVLQGFDCPKGRWSAKLLISDVIKCVRCTNLRALSLKKEWVKLWIGKLDRSFHMASGQGTVRVRGTPEGAGSAPPLVRCYHTAAETGSKPKYLFCVGTKGGLQTIHAFEIAVNVAGAICEGEIGATDRVAIADKVLELVILATPAAFFGDLFL